MDKWKISIIPQPMPTWIGIASREKGGIVSTRTRKVVQAWMKHIEPHVSPVGPVDYEDWAEQAVRLESGLRLLPKDTIVSIRDGKMRAYDCSGKMVKNPEDVMHRAQLGYITSPPTPDAIIEPYSEINRYASLNTVTSRLNREWSLLPADESIIRNKIASMLSNHDSVWLKDMIHPKNLMVKITDQEFFNSDTWEAITWECVRSEGLDSVFLLQEDAIIRNETRFFIIDGIPVTGAGCIEENTPLQNDGSDYDHKTEDVRGSGEQYESDIIESQLLPFVRDAAKDVTDESGIPHYVMDVGMINGKLGIIELNSIMNAGLYAINTDSLVTAMRDSNHPLIPVCEDDLRVNA
jgi:hypothetical protein